MNHNGFTCEQIGAFNLGTTTSCSHLTKYTPCQGQPPAYNNFRGEWRLVATQATPTFTLSISSESTTTTTDTTTWQEGLEATAEIEFLSTKVSASQSTSYERSVSTVLGESAKVTCVVPSNCIGNTWAYYVTGATFFLR